MTTTGSSSSTNSSPNITKNNVKLPLRTALPTLPTITLSDSESTSSPSPQTPSSRCSKGNSGGYSSSSKRKTSPRTTIVSPRLARPISSTHIKSLDASNRYASKVIHDTLQQLYDHLKVSESNYCSRDFFIERIQYFTTALQQSEITPRGNNFGAMRFYGNGSGELESNSTDEGASSNDDLEEELLIEERTEPWQIEYSSLKLGKKLAEGFFGEVYKGQLWGKKVAIKRLKLSSSIEQDEQMKLKTIRKLKEEAAIMSSLRHPNVLLFMGLCTNEEICLVTEYMDQGNLYEVLSRDTMVDDRIFFRMLVDICCGMNYLHNRSILHLDLKPLNLLVDEKMNIKVSDFGISRITKHLNEKIDSLTKYGTILYMPPEVLGMGVSSSEAYFDYTYDVFSFGVMLFELCHMREHPNINFSIADSVGFDMIREPLLRRNEPSIPIWWPAPLASLVRQCTSNDQTLRPTFDNILAELDKLKEMMTCDWFLARYMSRTIRELSRDPNNRQLLIDQSVWTTLDFFLTHYRMDGMTIYHSLCAMIHLAELDRDVSKVLQRVIQTMYELAFGCGDKRDVNPEFITILLDSGNFYHFQTLLDSKHLFPYPKDQVLGILFAVMHHSSIAEKFVNEGIIQYLSKQTSEGKRYHRLLHHNTCSILHIIVTHGIESVIDLFIEHSGLDLLIYFVNHSSKDSVFLALQTLAELSVFNPSLASLIEEKGVKPVQMASRAYLGALVNKRSSMNVSVQNVYRHADAASPSTGLSPMSPDSHLSYSNNFQNARNKLSNMLGSTHSTEEQPFGIGVDDEVVIKLWELLKEQVDLNRVDTNKVKFLLQQEFTTKLAEQKVLIDSQIDKIVGQMEPPSKITDNIYMGSEWNSSNLRDLSSCNINYIVNLSPDSPNYYPDRFTYYNIRMERSSTLSLYLDEFCQCLETAKKNAATVLVHSHLGVGRSVALVVAYLMKNEEWSLSRALKYVKDRRPFIQLSRTTMRSLMDIEIALGFKGSMGQNPLDTPVKPPKILVLPTSAEENDHDLELSFSNLSVVSPRVKFHNRRYSAVI